ncbi:hypothetical protein H1P_60039 [Hyella patelloides LEGE 07179]|uniref:Uncharacterized protein n=1 Tax=Hyella patelloides LEGE 07179 TaxID=945734 RepID=A0A563W1H2_9CYAN|nr:hypothetical protein H1P_60039 [Hyella patelloides LEGE 07179]
MIKPNNNLSQNAEFSIWYSGIFHRGNIVGRLKELKILTCVRLRRSLNESHDLGSR